MSEIFLETLLETLKILPFLYVTYLLMHFLINAHLFKNIDKIHKTEKFGPLLSGLLGAVPQCGFTAVVTELFSNRLVTIGTLIALYLSTSDEMLVILISKQVPLLKIFLILCLKVVIGIVVGFICDWLVFRKPKQIKKEHEHSDCNCKHHQHVEKEEDCKHCSCCTINDKNGKPLHPLIASLIHSLRIFIYVFIVSFIVHMLIHYIGEATMKGLLLSVPLLSYVISAIVGLIPNCAISVIITELWIDGMLSLGGMIAGLLTCSGVGLVILFHNNKNLKENFKIIAILLITGIFSGILIDFIASLI